MRLALVLLLVALLAGCASPPGERVAQPTDVTATIPRPTTNPLDAKNDTVDLDDPGYVLSEGWHEGDGWDWESSASHWRSVRVVAVNNATGTPFYRIERWNGTIGPNPVTRVSQWIDGRIFARINQTNIAGSRDMSFQPPAPDVRYYRNGTFRYSEVATGSLTSVATNSYYAGETSVQTVWGIVKAGRVEHRIARSGDDHPGRTLVIHSVWREAGNDVQIDDKGEMFRLVSYVYGTSTKGVLRSS